MSMAAMSGAWLRRKGRQGWEDGPCRLIMYLATISPQHKPAGQSNDDEAIEPHHASTANCSNSDLRSRSRASRPVHTKARSSALICGLCVPKNSDIMVMQSAKDRVGMDTS